MPFHSPVLNGEDNLASLREQKAPNVRNVGINGGLSSTIPGFAFEGRQSGFQVGPVVCAPQNLQEVI